MHGPDPALNEAQLEEQNPLAGGRRTDLHRIDLSLPYLLIFIRQFYPISPDWQISFVLFLGPSLKETRWPPCLQLKPGLSEDPGCWARDKQGNNNPVPNKK